MSRKKAPRKKAKGPLQVRLEFWSHAQHLRCVASDGKEHPVKSLAEAREYAAKNGYSGIRVKPT